MLRQLFLKGRVLFIHCIQSNRTTHHDGEAVMSFTLFRAIMDLVRPAIIGQTEKRCARYETACWVMPVAELKSNSIAI